MMEDPQAATTPKQELAAAAAVVAMMPTPGMGHLIPMIEFAKKLVRHTNNLRVTFLIPTDAPPSKAQNTVLQSLPTSISHIFLPPVSFSDLPSDTKVETLISLTVFRSIHSLRDALRSLSAAATVSAFIVDHFGTDAFDVGSEFGVPNYIFFASSATCLSFVLMLPHLDETVQCEYRELAEPVEIPGSVPIHGKDLLDPVQDRKNDAYKWILHLIKRYREAEGIIENSFLELEPGPIKELLKDEPGRPPIYPVGPLVNMESGRSGAEGSECLGWLDEQQQGSVLFVSFGSGGTLSSSQTTELALGLEMSEQRFLWVLKSPNDEAANASYFSAATHSDPLDFLPEGFLERTKGRGLVVPSWVPQPQVLAHGSTGGFLSHCGWNSILESLVCGVPFIAWPLFAEQRMNAIILSEGVNVALRPASVVVGENGLVERHEIASIVKCLMEGEQGQKLRFRIKDLKDAAASALAPHGSSTNHISNLALNWTNQNQK